MALSTSTTFKGNPFLFLIWLIPLGILILVLTDWIDSLIAIAGAFAIFASLLFFFRRYMFYFSILDGKLQIRNHVLSRHIESFSIEEICSVRIDSMAVGILNENNLFFIRVYTTPLSSRTFHGYTLRDKHWRALQRELKKYNIRVISLLSEADVNRSKLR